MDNNEDKLNDFQEQYDILVAEEKEKEQKKIFWILFFCLILVLLSVLTATYSYFKVYTISNNLNIDTNNDGKPDLNVDLNNDGVCDINCDIDNDGKPDLNLDYRNDLKPHFNLDLNNDGKADTNLLNQDKDNDGYCDVNCDTNGDGHPDLNLDIDGDGNPDLNIDTNNDGEPDLNIDSDGDGKPDLNIDTDKDGKPDKNVDTDGDGVCDSNCSNDSDRTPSNQEDDPIIEINTGVEKGILYVNYVKGIDIDKMMPGSSATQTFTVENQSDYILSFDVNWIDVKNELTVREGLTYQIRRDGAAITGQIPTPNKEGNILSKVIIAPHTKYTYDIVYTFHNLSDIDQTMDQNKIFTAKIKAEVIQ